MNAHLRPLLALLTLALAASASASAKDPTPAIAQPTIIQPGSATTSQAQAPSEVVEELHTAIVQCMKHADELGFQGRYDVLYPVVSKTFDLDFMGSKSMGRHWKKLSVEDQQLWLDKFKRLTTSNYAGRFGHWDGESFETISEEAAPRSTRMVITKLSVPSDEDVQLNYRLMETSDGWRIIDVYLNGTVSELALRRSEYSTALKRNGFDKVTTLVDEKIASLKEEGGG